LVSQIFYSKDQIPALDKNFIHYDNSGRDDVLREFSVFERLERLPAQKKSELWGAVSWRFTEKTGLTGEKFLSLVEAEPGFDLYYCNPFPEHEALYINGWQQGTVSHPAFIELCAHVLKAAELNIDEIKSVQSSNYFSACNYFLASPNFWGLYLPWVKSIISKARSGLPEAMVKVLDSRLSDPTSQHPGATYWPFIVERLLPQFLHGPGRDLKICKVALPATEARMNVHLQRLREMKDVAHRTRSIWMYSCWLNYRNIYLLQNFGKVWCRRYLPMISVAEPEFW